MKETFPGGGGGGGGPGGPGVVLSDTEYCSMIVIEPEHAWHV